MQYDGSVWINTEIDTDAFKNLGKDISNSIPSITSSLKKLGKTIAAVFAVREIVQFSKEAMNLGSDLQEVQNVVDVTFSEMSDTINRFAQNAIENFGLSELSAKQFASTMGAMLKSMGFTVEQATAMSIKLASLSGDIASFYNLDPDEAFAKIRSGISGETEPLKQLGINLSVANLEAYALAQGINKSYNAMSQQEQALLRYNYLLSVTADAQGDFARTSGSWANQTKILTERFNQLKATIGKGLIEALTPVVKMLNTLLEYLQKAADAFAAIMSMLFGEVNTKTSSSGSIAEDTAEGIEDVAGGYEDAADAADDYADSTAAAAKEAQRSVMAFDELNRVLAPMEEMGSGTNSKTENALDAESLIPSTIIAETNVEDKISPKIQAIVDKIKELIEPFKKFDFSPLRESLGKLGEAFEKLGSIILKALEWAWFNILVPLAKWTIEEAAPAVINALAEAFNLLAEVMNALKPLFTWLWDNFFSKLASIAGDAIIALINGLASGLDKLAKWISEHQVATSNILAAILGIIAAFKIWAGISPIVRAIKDIHALATGTVTVVGPVVGTILQWIGKIKTAFSSVIAFLGTLGSSIAGVISAIGAAVSSAVGWITGTMLPAISGAVSAIAAALGLTVGQLAAIAAAVTAAIALVVVYWDEIKQFFTTTFPSLIEQAKNTIKQKMEEAGKYFSELGKTISQTFQKAKVTIEENLEKAGQYVKANFIEPLREWFTNLDQEITTAMQNAGTAIGTAFLNTYKEIEANFIFPLKDKIEEIRQWIGEKFQIAKEEVQGIWEPFSEWFKQNVKHPIEESIKQLAEAIKEAFNAVVDEIAKTIEYLVGMVENAIAAIRKLLKAMKESVSDAGEAIGDMVEGAVKAVGSAVGRVVENVKSAASTVKKTLSSIGDAVKSAFSGAKSASAASAASTTSVLSTSLASYAITPDIPQLARGAVIPPNQKFLAVLGDQRHGTNIEAPLATIQEAVAMVMEDYIQSNLAGHEATVAVLQQILEAVLGIELDGETISRAINSYNRKMAVVRGG